MTGGLELIFIALIRPSWYSLLVNIMAEKLAWCLHFS